MTGSVPPVSLVIQEGQAGHDTGDHPENHRRMEVVLDHLRRSPGWDDREVLVARRAGAEEVALAHPETHFEAVREMAERGGGWMDGDTPVSSGSMETALEAVGGALTAVDSALQRDSGPGRSFALIRPPGHHATPTRAMGFCLFNNAAIAARYAIREYGLRRVAVVDWDVHHGNGTQDILWRDPSVLFVSLHQWPLYPGSGWLDEVGEGPGEGLTINLPMPPGSGDAEHLAALDLVVLPILDQYGPELIIVSAGQDGHHRDPLSHQELTTAGYRRMAERLSSAASGLEVPLIALHEGGYNLETLPRLDEAIIEGLAAGSGPGGGPSAALGVQDGVPDRDWEERIGQVMDAQRRYWKLRD